jgi:hypothetical protein
MRIPVPTKSRRSRTPWVVAGLAAAGVAIAGAAAARKFRSDDD